MRSIIDNSRKSLKPVLAAGIACLFSLCPALVNSSEKMPDVDCRLPDGFSVDFPGIEAEIWKSVMKRADESFAKLARFPLFGGSGHLCACGGAWMLQHFGHPDIPFPEIPKMPIGLPELFGNAENFMLAYGTRKIEFFRLYGAPDNTLEAPYDFLHPSEAWNLQSYLTLDASYEWEREDDMELIDEFCENKQLRPPAANYRIKFHENGKTVSVDVSLLKRHVRVLAGGAHSYGAKLSDFGYENLKQAIARVFPQALLE